MALVDIYFCLLCKGVLPACVYAQYSNVWCLGRTKEGTRSPGTGIIDCKLPHGCREPTVVPLQEHQLFLTTEPALQPKVYTSSNSLYSKCLNILQQITDGKNAPRAVREGRALWAGDRKKGTPTLRGLWLLTKCLRNTLCIQNSICINLFEGK